MPQVFRNSHADQDAYLPVIDPSQRHVWTL